MELQNLIYCFFNVVVVVFSENECGRLEASVLDRKDTRGNNISPLKAVMN